MRRRYRTVDVFTDRLFGGNPLAVVLDAQGLSTVQMQAIAAEFNYSETTFVLSPERPGFDATVRIFTPRAELPFAGHPNVGTAFVLAGIAQTTPRRVVFDEMAGRVEMTILTESGHVLGAELTAPSAWQEFGRTSAENAAAALSLEMADIMLARHAPVIGGVGIPFVFVEIASRDALRRARPDAATHRALFPLHGTSEIYAYYRENEQVVHARMFAPAIGIEEDPATGSATAAVAALIATREHLASLALRVHQGDDMGRPSLMFARAALRGDAMIAKVGGYCVPVMDGTFTLAGQV